MGANTYMTKSMAPSSATQRSAARLRSSNCAAASRSAGGRETRQGVETATAYIADVDSANANDSGAFADKSDLLGCLFRLVDVAPDDARIGAEVAKRPRLGAADVASASRHKDDAAICEAWSEARIVHTGKGRKR